MNKIFIKKLSEVGIEDVGEVGGKNASLGEMIQNLIPRGVKIPGGFVITAEAYRYFLEETGLKIFIKETLKGLDTKNLKDLARRGKLVRETIKKAEFPDDLKNAIVKAYQEMEKEYGKNVDIAVRSSATAEDLPGASFAGEHETYLNIRGAEGVLAASRAAMASLFTNRAISYRVDKGFDHFKIALSVGAQKMVRSDLSCSGVMFTLDTESGFRDAVLINGSCGLGEMIVQGEITPDEFLVFKKTLGKFPNAIISKKLGNKNRKMIYGAAIGANIKTTKIINSSKKENESFVLSDKEILQLAKWGVLIEEHYSKKYKKWTPMDMEWAKDGKTGELFIVQARPETVHALRDFSKIKEYQLSGKADEIVKGASVGNKIATGKARVILDAKNVGQFKAGEILITDMTDPDWEPIMKIASAIITDKGGRTSHAAIVSRELGIPCIVGSENATKKIKTGQMITVDTTGAEGFVYDGALKFKVIDHDVKKMPKPKTKIMMNLATPDTAFEKSFLPNDGVGLAREEFIIAGDIGIHPNALINYAKIPPKIKSQIDKKTIGYQNKNQFYVDKLSYGIAKIAAAFYPKPVIVRFSDFKTNEYKTLLGGEFYEPAEENPMIGWRGASRYYHPNFKDAFILELKAIKKVREQMGLDNVVVMVPFCRTAEEGRKVIKIMEENGLSRKSGLKVYVMCEIPSNVILADKFLDIFDGMSIGSNDLTQLTIGIDRDASELVRGVANEKDESVKKLISEVIKKCKARKKYIGICGQAPSDYPDFAEFLVEEGIESMSLNPDTIIKTTLAVAKKEKNKK
ncbi:phosphoenolpyruvate synthase [Candidatus Wolfebacteria bacterium]|nr:phosphoenolpyruvate synthase [Candidatus Wolfebacteria bacterium]